MQPEAIKARPEFSGVRALLISTGLPTEDLTELHCERFFYVGTPGAPSGLVGLEIFGEVALLRSLAVAAGSRRIGAGSALVSHAEREAHAAGVRTIYLLTTTAEAYFTNRGYQRTTRESAPPAIRATREFAGICPASSAFMTKAL